MKILTGTVIGHKYVLIIRGNFRHGRSIGTINAELYATETNEVVASMSRSFGEMGMPWTVDGIRRDMLAELREDLA